MKLPVWALTTSGALALLASSYDKATRWVEQSKDNLCGLVGGVFQQVRQDLDTANDVDYQGLVDQQDGGYRFRRDIPFPTWITVEETRTLNVEGGRVLEQSTAGTNSARLEGTFETRSRIQTGGGRLEWKIERSSFQPTLLQVARDSNGKGSAMQPVSGLLTSGLKDKTARFDWNGSQWRPTKDHASQADFIESAWARDLQKDLPVLLTIPGLMPRSMWFGDRRLALGEQMTLRGSQVSILTGHPAEGEVQLTLERIENLHSHPCAVLAWSGRIEAKAVPSPDAPPSNLKLHVTEGHAWMSLVYPVVLRSETAGTREVEVKLGTTSVRWQGATREIAERRWRVLK